MSDTWWMGSIAAQDRYNPEEGGFQAGIRDTPWHQEFTAKHGAPNLEDPNYDYRRAWAAGARPTVRDPGDGELHWPSTFKGANHPNRYVNGVDTISGNRQLPDVGAPLVGNGGQFSPGLPAVNRAADVASKIPGHMLGSVLSLPQRAIENSQYSLDTGNYDPSVPVEAALNTMGMGGIAGVPVKGGEAVLGAGVVRDPRMWSPLSKQKLAKPLDELEHQFTDVRSPVPKFVDPQSMVGGHMILTPWDLSRANRTLTHVDNIPLETPVRAHGGVGFPEANPGQAAASEAAFAKPLDNLAAEYAEKGPVYIAPMTMGPQGVDASHHVADPLAQLVRKAPVTKADHDAFNAMMRKELTTFEKDGKTVKKAPNWVDTDHPDFPEFIRNLKGGMTIKALMADRMALSEWQGKGFPNVAAIRHAMTEPALIDAPRNTWGMSISRYTPGRGLLDTTHPSYSKGVAGEYMGQLANLSDYTTGMPAAAAGLARHNEALKAAGRKNAVQPAYHAGKPIEGVPRAQYLDQEWLDNLMKQQEGR
jgi:hypothetical protein